MHGFESVRVECFRLSRHIIRYEDIVYHWLLVNTFWGGKLKGESVQFTEGDGLKGYVQMTRDEAIEFLDLTLKLLKQQIESDRIKSPWWQEIAKEGMSKWLWQLCNERRGTLSHLDTHLTTSDLLSPRSPLRGGFVQNVIGGRFIESNRRGTSNICIGGTTTTTGARLLSEGTATRGSRNETLVVLQSMVRYTRNLHSSMGNLAFRWDYNEV